MNCPICKHGHTQPGRATVTFERDSTTLVYKAVPAEVCDNCGEQYIDQKVTAVLLAEAEQAVNAGVELEVRSYEAA